MIQKIFSAFMSFIMAILSFFGIATSSNTPHEAIKYGSGSSQVMDIYVPNDAKDNSVNGAVLLIHGGMYTSGSRKEMAERCRALTAKGYVAATMDYTLVNDLNSGKCSVFTQLDEVDLAIQKLKSFSYEQKLNIKKVGLFGVAAGGHLALLYAYSRSDRSALEVAFTAAQAAPADFNYDIWKDNYTPEEMAKLVRTVSGMNVTATSIESGSAAKACEYISPISYIKKNSTIPALVAYGGKDTVVPYGNAKSLKAAFDSNNIKYDFYKFSDSGHSMSSDILTAAEYDNMLYRYCSNNLGVTAKK